MYSQSLYEADPGKSSGRYVWRLNNLRETFAADVVLSAYADAWLKEETGGYLPMTDWAGGAKVYDRILNDFYDEIKPLSQSKAYMVGPGNHVRDV